MLPNKDVRCLDKLRERGGRNQRGVQSLRRGILFNYCKQNNVLICNPNIRAIHILGVKYCF